MGAYSHKPVPLKCTNPSPWTGVKIGSPPQHDIYAIAISPIPPSSMLMSHTHMEVACIMARVCAVPTLNSGVRGDEVMWILHLGGDPIFTPVHGPHEVVVSPWKSILGGCMHAVNLNTEFMMGVMLMLLLACKPTTRHSQPE